MTKFFKNKNLLLFCLLSLTAITSKSQTNFTWGKQAGTDKEEYTLNHVIDQNGNIYVSGKTTGDMNGKNYGKNDGFITKIDNLGNTLWSGQFGTSEDEDILWSAIDGMGCVYITGSTKGALNERNFGMDDIFVVKYSPDGKMEWARQFGTDSIDTGNGIYTDKKGFIYVTGMTRGKLGKSNFGKADAFILKLDSSGKVVFINQFGTPLDDYSISVTGDGESGIYTCGTTWGDLGGKNKGFIDAFEGKFNDKGEPLKFVQFGTDGFDMALQIALDDKKNIYVGGSTSGNMGATQLGEGDCFLTKINPVGDIVWTKQFGTSQHDGIRGIDFNSLISDNILISGICNLPPSYAFVRMYEQDGTMLWEKNFKARGKNGDTSGKDVHLDKLGNIYHLGLTGANLFGSLLGGHDFYVVKFELDRQCRKH